MVTAGGLPLRSRASSPVDEDSHAPWKAMSSAMASGTLELPRVTRHRFICAPSTERGYVHRHRNDVEPDGAANWSPGKAKKTVKYANQNKIFQGHLALASWYSKGEPAAPQRGDHEGALSTATLMVLFGMPLFSSHLRQLVFGSHLCADDQRGFYLMKDEKDPSTWKKACSSLGLARPEKPAFQQLTDPLGASNQNHFLFSPTKICPFVHWRHADHYMEIPRWIYPKRYMALSKSGFP
eukprot:Skav231477  [mRNA]  locus=scaffold1100:583434:590485:- [translate_table: standard]